MTVIQTAASRECGTTEPRSILSQSITKLSVQEHYIGLFWRAYLPNGEQFSDEACGYTTCGWTRVAHAMCRDPAGWDDPTNGISLVRLAIIASSLCMVGNQHHDAHMVEYGHSTYGLALQRMRKILSRSLSLLPPAASTPTPTPTDQEKLVLLVASRLLTMFTLLFDIGHQTPTVQSQSWISLNAGERALLSSKEPDAYQDGDAHQIFVDSRLHLFLPSLISMQRPELLSDDKWMEVPWAVVPKTPMDRLVDLIGLLPALVADKRAMDVDFKSTFVSNTALQQPFNALIAKLQTWSDDIVPGLKLEELSVSQRTRASNKRKRAPESESGSGGSSSPGLGVAKAHAAVLFWATCLLYARSYPMFFDEDGDDDNRPALLNVRASRYNMLRILANVLFSPQARTTGGCWYGINVGLFPLRVVLGTVPSGFEIDGVGIGGNDDTGEFPLSPAESRYMASIYKECRVRGVASFIDSMRQYMSADTKD